MILEGFWERADRTAVQAGDSVTFICRVWQVVPVTGVTELDRIMLDNEIVKQSVYLYCPLSVAYCSQDCLLVDTNWPMRCTKQVRTLFEAQHVPTALRHRHVQQWKLQEVIYTLDIVTVGASGSWSCSYGGFQSSNSGLRVRGMF
ncbi:unnamed protein product [Echinostoma caproni]|uniref:Ig-like domain-containing protein n=1 Tax=Echinostoma caproni TaxID=27848 RepID=A0A183B695_9TREM|nr:unnamed protein product [Echinostoma caproni]